MIILIYIVIIAGFILMATFAYLALTGGLQYYDTDEKPDEKEELVDVHN